MPVTVHNSGVEPIAIGVDARTTATQTFQPVPLQGSTEVDLPEDFSVAPIYEVPPDTRNLTVTTSSTVPAQVELQGSAAGIDVFGDLKKAQSGSTVSVATIGEKKGYVSKGIWFADVQELGPFDQALDPAGTGGTPVIVAPGQTVTVTVTITPGGTRDSTTSGHLNLVTVPTLPTGVTGLPEVGTGEVIATLPYSYKIG